MKFFLPLIVIACVDASMQAQVFEPHVFIPKTELSKDVLDDHLSLTDVTVQRMNYSIIKEYYFNSSTGLYDLHATYDSISYKFSGDRFTSPASNQFDSSYCILSGTGVSNYSRIKTYNSMNKPLVDKKIFDDDVSLKDERHYTYHEDQITVKSDSSSIYQLPFPNFSNIKLDYNEHGQVTKYFTERNIYNGPSDNFIVHETFNYDELNRLKTFHHSKVNYTMSKTYDDTKFYFYDGDFPYPYKDSMVRVTDDLSPGFVSLIVNNYSFDSHGYPASCETYFDGSLKTRDIYEYSDDGLLLNHIKYKVIGDDVVPEMSKSYSYNPSQLLTQEVTSNYDHVEGVWYNFYKEVYEYIDDLLSVYTRYNHVFSSGIIPESYIIAEDSLILNYKTTYYRNSFGNTDSVITESSPVFDYSTIPVVSVLERKVVSYYNYDEAVVDMPDVDASSAYVAFPNPVTDVLTIHNPLLESLEIKIFDISGQTRKRQKNNRRVDQVKVEVSELDKGWYILEVMGDNGKRHTQKVFKQ